MSRRKASSRRSASCSTASALTREAASSRASGTPSRRRQTWATAGAFSAVRAKPGATATARSTNRRTASPCARRPASTWPRSPRARAWARAASGRAREGTRQAVSPAIPSASRLVARTCTPGQARSTVSASRAQASRTCSQLSSTSCARLGRSAAEQLRRRGQAGVERQPQPGGDGGGDALRVGQGGQLDQPDAVGEALHGVRRRLQRQARLAAAAGPDEGEQPRRPAGP